MLKVSKMIFVLVLTLSLLGVFSTDYAYSQEEEVVELGEVVITGTKTEKRVKDAPVRTEVITSKEIEDKGATNLYEALEGIPGIRVEQQCSYCNFSILRMQGLEAGHVQVLIDGQPMYSGLASVYGLQQVPAGNIERIEVVKGAGSALYGSSAIAGVINIITKKPTEKPTAKITTSFGTANTNSSTLTASTKGENMEIMLTAQKMTGDEIDEDNDGFTDRVKSDNTTTGITVNWYELAKDDQLTLSLRTLKESRKGGELATFDSPYAEAAEHIDTTRNEAQIGYKKSLAKGRGFSFNLAYSKHDRDATNDTFVGDYLSTPHDMDKDGVIDDLNGDGVIDENDTGRYPPVDEMRPYLAEETLYILDANYSFQAGEKHQLLAGIQYSKNEMEESGKYVIVDEEDPDDYGKTYLSQSEKSAKEWGIYLQDDIFLRDNLELVLGVRYDKHSSEDNFGGCGDAAIPDMPALKYDESSFSPRAALMYKASPKLTLRSSLGTGFRVPFTFSEDLHLCSGSPRVYKGGDLKPEKSVSLNVGADYHTERFALSANIFRTNLKDKIGFVDASEDAAGLGYTYEWQNIGDAYTQGIELGLRMPFGENLTCNLNLAYTDAQYKDEREDWVNAHPEYADDSKYISRTPEMTGGIKLYYRPVNWELGLDCVYTGSMYIDYCEEEDVEEEGSYIKHTDPFWVVGVKLSKKFPGRGITTFAGVKNLFDYVQDEKHPDDAAFMWAPYTGRVIYGGMEVEF